MPSRNRTLPVGVADEPGAATVAVRTTDWPGLAGLAEETRAVVEPISPGCVTVWANPVDVLAASVESPA